LTTKGGSGIKAFSTVHDRTIVVLTVLIVLAFTFAVVSAQPVVKTEGLLISTSQSPAYLATAFDDDLNNHNSSAALGLFADNATVADLSSIAECSIESNYCLYPSYFVGTTQIRGWLDAFVSSNVQLNETRTIQVSGNNVSWSVGVSVDAYRKVGIAELVADVNATVENGKFSLLAIGLTAESTRAVLVALAASHKSPYSALAGGVAFGVTLLGFVFPSVGVYYVSRVKRLFVTVPHLDKPWVLLGAGLGVLFVSVLILSLRDFAGISVELVDPLFSATLTICAFLVMASMILMKRVMLGEPDE
jgi:hypothetical protein